MEHGGPITTYQKVKVLTLFLVWITMGLYLEIPGPTLIDIKLLFHASYEEVSRSVSGRGAGGFIGALLGGILVDKFENSMDLLVAVPQTVASLAVLTIPFSLGISFLWFHYLTLGICSGIMNIAGTRLVIMLSGEKSSVTLQLLASGYGLGALLVPVIVNPFLAVIQYKKGTGDQPSNHDYVVQEDSRVQFAFVFIGIVSFILSLAFFYFHCCGSHNNENKRTLKTGGGYKAVDTDEDTQTAKTTSQSWKDMLNPATYTDGSFGFGVYMFIVLFLYYFNLTGGEEVFGNFVRSFSVDAFKFSKSQASYLNMTFWLSLTLARFVIAVISHYVPIRRLFKIQVLLHLISTIMLTIYASKSPSWLWVCTILEGVAISPLYPSGIAYGNTQMDMTGVCLMVISFSGALGDLAYIWVVGNLYDSYGPSAILLTLLFTGVVLFLCVILFRITERSEKDRNSNVRPKNPFTHICYKCTSKSLFHMRNQRPRPWIKGRNFQNPEP